MNRILDLFAGAGGLSLGFEMTRQFEVVAIVENNKNAAKTYMKNHPGIKNYDDILKVNFAEVIKEEGPIDVVVGGPPCQGFSNANRQRRHLINGSNELVKRYVEAIEQIKPKVFVMENVKTIASDKQSFCLTYSDEKYIRNILKLQIYDKDIVLYEGEYVREINNLCLRYNPVELVLLSEEQLYLVYNLCKKKKHLQKYFSKSSNIKKVQGVILNMLDKPGFPRWYNRLTIRTRDILQEMVDLKGNIDLSLIGQVKKFWDVQRCFQGILELEHKDALYQRITSNRNIIIRMQTYIVIDYIRHAFNHLGYETNGEVLNAVSFGVPQSRERFIMIGIKKELTKETITLPVPLIKNPDDYVTVKQAIGDLVKYTPTTASMNETQKRRYLPAVNSFFRKIIFEDAGKIIFNHVCTQTREIARKRFENIEPGKNFHSLPKGLKSTYENPSRTQNTIYKRLVNNLPSDTVVNVRKSMWIHPELNRSVSAREAARLQSFPDNYIFYGTKDSVYQQIGNAVPPLLGRAVAERVIELIGCEEKYETLKEIYDSMQ